MLLSMRTWTQNVRGCQHRNIGRIFCSFSSSSNSSTDERRLKVTRLMLADLGTGFVKLQKDYAPGIALITLNNAKKRNTLSGRMMTQLESAVDELESWQEGKGVLLQSEGDVFCHGGEGATAKSLPNLESAQLMCRFMHKTFSRFQRLPLITVALVHGKAIGGGVELASMTDFRLFTPSASAGFVQGPNRLIPVWGGGTRLVELIGSRVALDLLTTNSSLTAADAISVGFADGEVAEETRLEEALQWLQARTHFTSQVIRGMKKITLGARDSIIQDSLQNEFEVFSAVWKDLTTKTTKEQSATKT